MILLTRDWTKYKDEKFDWSIFDDPTAHEIVEKVVKRVQRFAKNGLDIDDVCQDAWMYLACHPKKVESYRERTSLMAYYITGELLHRKVKLERSRRGKEISSEVIDWDRYQYHINTEGEIREQVH